MHDAHEDRAQRDRLAEIVGIKAACAVNGQIRHTCAEAFEKTARLNNCRMLDPRGDDVIALVAKREECALKRKIICFAAAAGENDLIVVAAEQRRHWAARCLEGGFCPCGRPMSAGPIAVVLHEKRAHCGSHRRIDWRAGVVIEIDGLPRQLNPWPCSPWASPLRHRLPPEDRPRSIAPFPGATR